MGYVRSSSFLPPTINECVSVCMHGWLMTGIRSRVYPCFTPSVPRVDSRFPTSVTENEQVNPELEKEMTLQLLRDRRRRKVGKKNPVCNTRL